MKIIRDQFQKSRLIPFAVYIHKKKCMNSKIWWSYSEDISIMKYFYYLINAWKVKYDVIIKGIWIMKYFKPQSYNKKYFTKRKFMEF